MVGKLKKLIFFIFVLLVCVNTSLAETEYKYGVMHFTKEQRAAMAAKSTNNLRSFLSAEPLPKAERNLLNYMPYLGVDRDQGSCGNCWVWAATGALEIQNKAFNKIDERLSIQYFNSNYNYPDYYFFACDGGLTSQFVRFYSQKKIVIPWSNHNAEFADKNGGKKCEYENQMVSCPSISPSDISEEPHYKIPSLGIKSFSYDGDNDSTKELIKHYINQNVPVIYTYCMDLDKFTRFWSNKGAEELYVGDKQAEQYEDCHATVLVGYNDLSDNKAEHYYEILNSWGTTDKRPNGTFRISMDLLRYDVMDFYVLDTGYQNVSTKSSGNVKIKLLDDIGRGVGGTMVIFNDIEYYADETGVIIINNLENGLDYKLEVPVSNGYYYEGETLKCFEYPENIKIGKLDFSKSKEANFVFEGVARNSPENTVINILLRDFTGKEEVGLENVTIDYDGSTYVEDVNKWVGINIENVPNHSTHKIQLSKDGYLFEPSVIDAKIDIDCTNSGEFPLYSVIVVKKTVNKLSVKLVDNLGNPLKNEKILFNTREFSSNDNGEVVIENLSDGEYTLEPVDKYGSAGISENGFAKCYAYHQQFYQGKLDFSEEHEKTLTLVKDFFNLNEKGGIIFEFVEKDDDGYNLIKQVQVNYDYEGNTYDTGKTNELLIHDIQWGKRTYFSFYKDGYIFEPSILEVVSYPERNLDLSDSTYCSDSISGNWSIHGTKVSSSLANGNIELNFIYDATGGAEPLSGVLVKFNGNQEYSSDSLGTVRIEGVNFDESFKISWEKEGYKFESNSYEGTLSAKYPNLRVYVPLSADNCLNVPVDLAALKNDVKKLVKLANIAKGDAKIVKAKKSFFEKLAESNRTNMTCAEFKQQLLSDVKVLQKRVTVLNKQYARKYGKNKKWLKVRLAKIKIITEQLNEKIAKI